MKRLLFLLIFLIATIVVGADIKIPLQGYLTDNEGNALNGEKQITFSLYNIDEGGQAVWSEEATVNLNNGEFSYMLGTTEFIDSTILENSSPFYLEVKIENETLTPRIELGVEAKSAFSYNTEKLQGKNLGELKTEIKEEITNEKLNDILTRLQALENSKAELEQKINELETKNTELENRIAVLENNQFSGDYNDLTNKPDFTGWDKNEADDFSGDYNDLANKPTTITPEQADMIIANNQKSQDNEVAINELETRTEALETKTEDMYITTVNGYKTVRFSGVNLQIVNGTGATSRATLTDVTGRIINGQGLGNLIIGYNEIQNGNEKTGFHNLVMGTKNSYTSYSGIVNGTNNKINNAFNTILSGFNNTASAPFNFIASGSNNTTNGYGASILNAYNSEVTGKFASIVSGENNKAQGDYSTVSTGKSNKTTGKYSSVTGGDSNTASGNYASVSGGEFNEAKGYYSSVSGGSVRTARYSHNWRAGSLLESE